MASGRSPLPPLVGASWRLAVSSASSEVPVSLGIGQTAVQLALVTADGRARNVELSLEKFAKLLTESEKALAIAEG